MGTDWKLGLGSKRPLPSAFMSVHQWFKTRPLIDTDERW